MDLNLKGKVALVTGAGSQKGFGKGIVLALAREECDIIATDIDLKGAEKTAVEVETLGCRAVALKADVTSSKEIDDMVRAGLSKFGKIDILVNNAGVATPLKPFVNTTEADWDQDININYKGTLRCTLAVLPQMLERKSGKIINISSIAAITAAPQTASYSSAKIAVLHFSKILAAEVISSGINVNVILPDIGDTGFFAASGAPPQMLEKLKELAAAGQTVTPQDIGSTVAFLASDFSNKVNGQVIRVGIAAV